MIYGRPLAIETVGILHYTRIESLIINTAVSISFYRRIRIGRMITVIAI